MKNCLIKLTNGSALGGELRNIFPFDGKVYTQWTTRIGAVWMLTDAAGSRCTCEELHDGKMVPMDVDRKYTFTGATSDFTVTQLMLYDNDIINVSASRHELFYANIGRQIIAFEDALDEKGVFDVVMSLVGIVFKRAEAIYVWNTDCNDWVKMTDVNRIWLLDYPVDDDDDEYEDDIEEDVIFTVDRRDERTHAGFVTKGDRTIGFHLDGQFNPNSEGVDEYVVYGGVDDLKHILKRVFGVRFVSDSKLGSAEIPLNKWEL